MAIDDDLLDHKELIANTDDIVNEPRRVRVEAANVKIDIQKAHGTKRKSKVKKVSKVVNIAIDGCSASFTK